jgi:hypothetical protein
VVAVDDRDDELGGLVQERRPRLGAREAERGSDSGRRGLVLATACGGKPGQEEKQDP